MREFLAGQPLGVWFVLCVVVVGLIVVAGYHAINAWQSRHELKHPPRPAGLDWELPPAGRYYRSGWNADRSIFTMPDGRRYTRRALVEMNQEEYRQLWTNWDRIYR